MRVVAALCWWNELPGDLAACIRGIGNIADKVVAVDGAYRRYPGATVRSSDAEVRAIRETAAEVGIECEIIQPDRLWLGQVEKRTFLLQEAAKGADWLVIVDADHIIHTERGAARAALAAMSPRVNTVQVDFATPMNEGRPLDKSAATNWHIDMTRQTFQLVHIVRAFPDMHVEKKHWIYQATLPNGTKIEMLYGATNGDAMLGVPYVVDHMTLFRTEKQILDGRAFCNDRERIVAVSGQEDDLPELHLLPPAWDFKTLAYGTVEIGKVPKPEKLNSKAPWTDVTFAGVYWNEAERLPALLRLVRPWFTHLVVGVQASTDNTLEIAREYADVVIEDAHHGFAEATFGKVLAAVRTPWTFVVSGDELPSFDLLDSFQAMLDSIRDRQTVDGFRVKFHSTIDGLDFTHEQDLHLRVFRTGLRWPVTMHSEPQATTVESWSKGYISHDRTLDEMVLDYLRYYAKGRGNKGWDDHNSMMMREACKGVAQYKGWTYVKAFPWWPEVLKIGFSGVDPTLVAAK